MFTLFTVPKSFADPHINLIQTNAFRSWKALESNIEIFIFGDDEGVREKAIEFNFTHLSEIEKNEFGTPLLDSIFKKANQLCRWPYLVFVNSDIIIPGKFLKIFCHLPQENFFISGQRYDIDITEPINFKSTEWEGDISAKIENFGILHPPTGGDYFIFNRDLFVNIPPFAVGRVTWDNWMIQESLLKNIKTVDASDFVKVIHQNHNYNHQINKGINKINSQEGQMNFKLVNSKNGLKTLEDMVFKFDNQGGIVKKINLNKKNNSLFRNILRKIKKIIYGL